MNQLWNQTIEENLVRAVIAVKALSRKGCTVLRVETGMGPARIDIAVDDASDLRGSLIKTLYVESAVIRLYSTDCEGCHVQWETREPCNVRPHAEGIPPCVGEKMRDAMHAIAHNGMED